jgi:hypothetical protein
MECHPDIRVLQLKISVLGDDVIFITIKKTE